jgi:hypothetical protein
LYEIEKVQKSRNREQSALWKRVSEGLLAINEHAKAIDVLIQQQPDITALVWGATRFLIAVRNDRLIDRATTIMARRR